MHGPSRKRSESQDLSFMLTAFQNDFGFYASFLIGKQYSIFNRVAGGRATIRSEPCGKEWCL
ncbi:MAG: hypothetical protein ACI4C4_05715 [Lachnospiraceae bacterium]